MNLGLFMQPVHRPDRDYTQVLEEDREAVMLADQLGFAECWIGEHFTATTEPITSPLTFCASLINQTTNIRFGTGVVALPAVHPVIVASQVAMFDHLSRGRCMFGVGPGTLSSDVEVFNGGDAAARGRQVGEALDIILELWASDAPYEFKGEFYDFALKDLSRQEWGVGQLVKPYQQPHPPIALSLIAPGSFSAGVAGERGWLAISGNFVQPRYVATHWAKYVEGCAKAGRRPDRDAWRVARSIIVGDDAAEVSDYVADPQAAPAFYFGYLMESFRSRNALFLLKADESVADDALTPADVAQSMFTAGTPASVLDQLIAFRDEVGDFGTLLSVAHDWDRPAFCKRSMTLLAEQVMPRFTQHCEAAAAAE